MLSKKLFSVLVVLYVAVNAYCNPDDWIAYARTMNRESIAVDGPNVIDANTLEWMVNTDPQDANFPLMIEGATQPIVYNGTVYVYAKYFEPNELGGRDYTNSQIVAYDASSGDMLWTAVIDISAWGLSWSSPCVDTKHNAILMVSGGAPLLYGTVYAIDATTGAIVWTRLLESEISNASICIVGGRAFITDSNFTLSAKLYCIDLDNDGQIIWSQNIGFSSGGTPSYRDGVIYVASAGDDFRGTILAYDAAANSAVELWRFTNVDYAGFFGGVTVTKEGYLYAATCAFSGDEENSTMFKIDCNDGSMVWSIPVQATDCVPVVVGDMIYVSGEYPIGNPKLKAYRDSGTSVVKLWETSSELAIGSWDDQPVYADGKIYIGGGEYDELHILNAAVEPNDANFVIAQYIDYACGFSRAVTYDSIYATGFDGLFKFYQPALLADIDGDLVVDGCDLLELTAQWLYDDSVGIRRADLNLDGKIDFADFGLLAGQWFGEID